MSKSNHSKSSTTKALEKATKEWRSAKKRERAARNALAAIVNEAVASGVMSENKVASVTEIPRMTIRKMLGKDEAVSEAVSEAPAAAETAPETAQAVDAVPDAPVDAVPDAPVDAVPDAPVDAVAAAADIVEPDSTSPDAAAEAAADVSESGSEEIESPIAAVTSRPAPIWGASSAS